MMEKGTFNLLHEPWILLKTLDGRDDMLSLTDLFRDAHQIRGLAGELEGQNIAVLRLLLSILYAVFVRRTVEGQPASIDSYPDAEERWKSLWERGRFPSEIIEDYLQRYEHRFWLLHPSHPFFQVGFKEDILKVAEGSYIKPTEKPPDSLIGDIAESGNKKRTFRPRYGQKGIPYSEAARWLLYLNAFDTAPAGAPGKIETGLVVKGYGVGWLGKIGSVWVSGSNLFETLLMNLVLFSIADESIRWDTCIPEWEKEETITPSMLTDKNQTFPTDLCALYSFQFRRVRLLADEVAGLVTGYQLWSGQNLETTNALMEPMTAWRKKDDGYVPKTHDPARRMWRDYAALLPASGETELIPGVVKWLTLLRNSSALTLPFIRLNIFGITYTNNTAVEQVFSDGLNINAGLLTKLGQSWNNRVRQVLNDTNKLVNHLVSLDRDLRKASGDSDSPKKLMEAVEQAFYALDEPFRIWLESIRPEEDDMDDKCLEWRETSKRVVRGIGERLVINAGSAALRGRTVQEDVKAESSLYKQIINNIETGFEVKKPKPGNTKREKRYTAAEAFDRFLARTK